MHLELHVVCDDFPCACSTIVLAYSHLFEKVCKMLFQPQNSHISLAQPLPRLGFHHASFMYAMEQGWLPHVTVGASLGLLECGHRKGHICCSEIYKYHDADATLRYTIE